MKLEVPSEEFWRENRKIEFIIRLVALLQSYKRNTNMADAYWVL